MAMEEEIKWLWKLSPSEKFFKPYTTLYRIICASRKPLLEEHFILTFKHLFRRVPSLRTCFAERDGELWLREMPKEMIDFEVISTGTITELFTLLQDSRFNEKTGPLWCVKLLPAETESGAEFPNVYHLFMGVNHVISDGTSNIKICGFLAHLLDDVISERSVDDAEQLGVFVSEEKTQALIQERMDRLEADPQLRLSLKEEYDALQSRNSLFKSTFKGVTDSEPRSVLMTQDLEVAKTTELIKRCRLEGVTVNSAFTALANIAMMELLAEGGLSRDTYIIRSDHAIDARRYWAEETSPYLGLHILPIMPVFIETPRNARQDVWSYIKLVHQELYGKIKNGRPLEEEALKRSSTNSYTFDFEFAVSNMGDVTKQLTKGVKNVCIHHILRASKIHPAHCTFSFYTHTLSDCLTVTLVHSTEFVQQETAQRFMDLLFDVLRLSAA